MKPCKLFVLLWAAYLWANTAFAYQPIADNEQFFARHLKQDSYPIDAEASAIVLYDRGNYSILQRADGTPYYNVTARRVIKILTAGGVKQADISIPFMSSENVSGNALKVKAKTYNLVNGEIKVTELDDKVISVEVANEYVKLLKFSMPAVVPGSVIEYSYEINHDPTYQLVDWAFQDEVPVLHSEVTATYPDGFFITALKKTSKPFVLFDEKDIAALPDSAVPLAYNTQPSSFGGRNTLRWVRRNLTAIKEEPFNYNIGNYVERLTVYLAGTIYDSENISDWEGFNKMVQSSFSSYTNNLGGNMAVKELREKMFRDRKFDTGLDSAKYVYNYIKKNFTISPDNSGGRPEGKIEKLVQQKKGDALQTNLLLVKLFNDMGYKSNMVLLATRDGLRLSPEYPVMDNIDYAICRTEIGNERYYVDCGARYYPFGVLPPKCYNGFSWAVSEKGFRVNISPDEIRERSLFMLSTENAEAANYIIKLSVTTGDVSGAEYREKWVKDSSEIKVYVANQLKVLPFNCRLLNYEVENLEDTDKPLKITCRAKVEWPKEDKLFLTPSLFNHFTENPFKESKRTTPVEMPYAVDANYMLMLQLPEGYHVEEAPESKVLKLDNNNSYKYLAEYKAETNMLMVSTRLHMTNTYFEPTNYAALQTFFDKVMEQQASKGLISKK